MKNYIMLSMFIFSINAFASTTHNCTFGGFDLKILTDKENDISLEIFKGKNKISACNMKTISYEDGKNNVSTTELIRFEKKECNIIYNKIASKIVIIDKGFIKTPTQGKISYAYVIKNEHPLVCQKNH